MARSCEQALAIGLPGVAFTEHLEFTAGGEGDAIVGVATDARWWTREQVQAGEALTPPTQSISWRLIESWLKGSA